MRAISKILSLLFSVFLVAFIACGGSSGSGDMVIEGTLSTGALRAEIASVAGIKICCGGQCDTTDANGNFYLATDVAESLYCTATGDFTPSLTARMTSEQTFVILALGSEGLYLVEVTVTLNDATGEVEISTRTLRPEEVNPNACGNGVTEITNDEECDGADLGGADCRSLNFAAGTLSCNADCSLNTSKCDKNEDGFCGDGIIDSPGEECEGADLDGATCESLGFLAGTLSCDPGCMFDTSSCTDVVEPPTCGNNQVEAGEDCEGADLRGETCESLGFKGGTLSCNSDCSYNESLCEAEITPTCMESEKICGSTGLLPECFACSCDDGFPIGDCNAICFDTGSAPTVCSGGVGCPDGQDPVCPG